MSKVSREEFEWLKRNTKESLGKLFERFYKLEAAIEEIKKGTRHKVGELRGIDIISDPDCKEPHFEKPQPKAEPPLPLDAEIERILGNEVEYYNNEYIVIIEMGRPYGKRSCRPFSTDVATALEGLGEYCKTNKTMDETVSFIYGIGRDTMVFPNRLVPERICMAIKADHARRKPC
jgi:hypothetical protein